MCSNGLMVAPPARPDAIIFDCDGLLVDTESRWSIAEASLFARHGFPFGPAQKELLIGHSIEDATARMAEHFGRPGTGNDIAAELLSRVRAAIDALAEPLPGAAEMVRACAAKVRVAVASNSPRDLLDLALKRSGLAELLPVSVAADEVSRPKPDPELYLAACARLGAEPSRSVAFEDSGTGVAAARAAGLYVVTVPSMPDARLDSDWQLDSLADPALLAWASAISR